MKADINLSFMCKEQNKFQQMKQNVKILTTRIFNRKLNIGICWVPHYGEN